MSRVNVLGVQVDRIKLESMLAMIREVISTDQRALITHVNIRGLHFAYEQEWFREFLNSSDLVVCDGMGVMMGARILGAEIPQRFTHADWTWKLTELADVYGDSLFLLGGQTGVANKAAIRLKERYPKLKVVGTHHGYFNKTIGDSENEFVVEQINAVKPDILLVGFGMPIQEKWLKENWDRLDVKIAITCGAVFEYLSGELKRGPRWMTENYLEWFARILISPGRYWKRYLRDNPLFLYRVLKQKYFGNQLG